MKRPRTWHGGYVSAYGIAVKHGFVGSEQDWLRSLCCEMRYNEETKQLEYKPRCEEEWLPLMSLADLQSGTVADTIEELSAFAAAVSDDAANAAESAVAALAAAAAAQTASESAIESSTAAASQAENAGDSEALARQHAAAAEASSGLAAQSAALATQQAVLAGERAQLAADQATVATTAKTTAEAKANLAKASAESVSEIAESVGEPGGIAALDETGKVPITQLPALGLSETDVQDMIDAAIGNVITGAY